MIAIARPGDAAVRLKVPSVYPEKPARLGGGGDAAQPMTGRDVREAALLLLHTNKAHQHCDKLRPGDAAVAVKRAVGVTGDIAALCHRRDRLVIPGTGADILVRVLRRVNFSTPLLRQQLVEHGRRLCPGQRTVGTDSPIGIAADISHMVLPVEIGRRSPFHNCGLSVPAALRRPGHPAAARRAAPGRPYPASRSPPGQTTPGK